MPFADVSRPAIGVSLLKASAIGSGFSATIHYCNFHFAELMGCHTYQSISSSFAPEILLGEWFFADELFGNEIPPEDDYFEKILGPLASPDMIVSLREARKMRRQYLDNTVQKITELAPRVVGFTTTFHQTCSSLAIAKRLKQMPNPPIVLFGGANCEGEMGLQLLQSFPGSITFVLVNPIFPS